MASLVYRQTEAKLKPFSPGKESFAGRVCFRSTSDSLSGLRVWVPTSRGSAGRCWDPMSSSCAWGTHITRRTPIVVPESWTATACGCFTSKFYVLVGKCDVCLHTGVSPERWEQLKSERESKQGHEEVRDQKLMWSGVSLNLRPSYFIKKWFLSVAWVCVSLSQPSVGAH